MIKAGEQHLQQARKKTCHQIAILLDNITDEQVLKIEESLLLLRQVFELNVEDV